MLLTARQQEGVPESQWETVRHSQHLACDQCGRSFEQLTPHSFSFNSPLGWCPACEGLGTQTGANPAALLNDPKRSLADGAVALWPAVSHQVSQWMLAALSAATGIPLDVPFEQLSGRHRRIIMHGFSERWLDVYPDGKPIRRTTAVPVPVQRTLSGLGGSGSALAFPAFAAGTFDRRSCLFGVRW